MMDVLVDLAGDSMFAQRGFAAAEHNQALRLEQTSCLGRTPPAIALMASRYLE